MKSKKKFTFCKFFTNLLLECNYLCNASKEEELKLQIKEELSPDSILKVVNDRIYEIESIINHKKQEIKTFPNENLRITTCPKRIQFYKTDKKGELGKYIPKSQEKIINQLLQKKYDVMLVSELENELSLLKNFQQKYSKKNINQIFFKIPVACRNKITPVTFPKEELIRLFDEIKYEQKPFTDNSNFITESGINVRSKSEIMIADALSRNKIPFKYEMPQILTINNRKVTFYPDFTCLNYKTHEIFLWEHLGIMDNDEYAENAVAKINIYQKNGFYLGKNLILSMETKNNPLSSKMVAGLIENYF